MIRSKSDLIDKSYKYAASSTTKNHIYILYKNRNGNYIFTSFNVATLKSNEIKGKLSRKLPIGKREIMNEVACFYSYTKRVGYLYAINLKTGEQKGVPIKINNVRAKKTVTEAFQILKKSNEIVVCLNTSFKLKKNHLYIQRFNSNLEMLSTLKLTENVSQSIVNVSVSELNNGKLLLLGTFSGGSQARSEGIFISRLNNKEIEYLKFYNYSDFDKIYSYLSERKQEKIIRKRRRKERRGKHLNSSFRIEPHNAIILDDGYMFVGESYYPTYQHRTYSTYSANGVYTTHSSNIFDGFQYTHAVLARFDKNGQFLWDEALPMWPFHKPFFVKKFISLAKQKQSINMVFEDRSQIISATIDFDGNTLCQRMANNIKTNAKGDYTRWTSSVIEHWYGNNFIVHGNQKIKNKKNSRLAKKRKVYFINKIEF
ncbi:MAG: hypothetical protein U9R19_00850 [Bacteroidota bacterium]|nr:hypothetical protein [Bacteroidota bacterium]